MENSDTHIMIVFSIHSHSSIAESVRFDAVQYDRTGTPIRAWDYKTGSATLTQGRINQMQRRSGLFIPIEELR